MRKLGQNRHKIKTILACLAVAAMAAGTVQYGTGVNAETSYTSLKDVKGKKKGIDISGWQDKINWDKLEKQKLDFVIIKCGSGNTEVDSQWRESVRQCRKRKIPFGVYLYSYAKNTADAVNEAKIVIERLQEMDIGSGDLEYPIYYDLEDDSMPHDKEELQKITEAFMSTLRDAGYNYLGVYANRYWFNKYLNSKYYNQYSKWVAEYDYDVKYAKKIDIWQFTSNGRISGVGSRTDVNYLIHEPKNKDIDDVDNITAMDSGAESVSINWTISDNADGYEVYRSSDDGKYKKLDDVEGQFYYIDGNTEKGKSYKYKIRPYKNSDAKKIYGTSTYTDIVKKK